MNRSKYSSNEQKHSLNEQKMVQVTKKMVQVTKNKVLKNSSNGKKKNSIEHCVDLNYRRRHVSSSNDQM